MFRVGVDLGQHRDHKAIAAVEKAGSQRLVWSIVRVPLGTPYPEVIERVRRTVELSLANPPLFDGGSR